MLTSAREHYARQRLIARQALLEARRRRFGPLAGLVAAVSGAQVLAAREVGLSVPAMLEEQGVDPSPVAAAAPAALAGVAGDGRSLAGLLDYTRQPEVTPHAFALIVLTQLQDTARHMAAVEVAARPQVTSFTRMLVAPSCSRCAILAGRVYRWNRGFLRHPRCDCRHVPTTESAAGDLTTDPSAYFDSLDTAAQDRIFTQAGAQAIRDGADPAKVVNARRGMTTAQTSSGLRRAARRDVYGRPLYTTTELAGGRVRLMPESIYEIADDRTDALRLLKSHGYIT